MRVITLKGENNISALADRLFINLTPQTRQMAESSLLKANPHLAGINAFKPGTVVQIPVVPGLKAKPSEGGKDPRDDLLDGLQTAVADYRDHLASALEVKKRDIDAQMELLKQPEVAALLKKTPGAEELAKDLSELLMQEARSLPEEKKSQDELFARIEADLASLR